MYLDNSIFGKHMIANVQRKGFMSENREQNYSSFQAEVSLNKYLDMVCFSRVNKELHVCTLVTE